MALDLLYCLTCNKKGRLHLLVAVSSSLTCLLILLVFFGCDGAHAGREKATANEPEAQASLKLTTDQIAFIEENVAKEIASHTYWTWPNADRDPFYVTNAGKKVPAKLISFEHAAIVWMNDLRIVSVAYIKMPDGQLDYPGSVDFSSGGEDIEELIRAGKLRPGNWDIFLMMLDYYPELRLARQEKNKYEAQFPSTLKRALAPHGPGQKNKYDTEPTSPKAHSVMDVEITLPELGAPSYEPMTEAKELLLGRILKEAQHQADMMFEKQETVSITVPNFNVGEAGIEVLIQDEKGGGVIVGIQLTTNPKEHPVFFGGVVTYDIRANRYGLGEEAQATKMIKERALKVLRYAVKNPA